MFSIKGRKVIGSRRYGGGESSSKFCSLYYIYYAYALYKTLVLKIRPTAYPISLITLNFKS